MAIATIADLSDANVLLGGEVMELQQLSPSVKITAITLSAEAADNSYNDSANGLIAAGFAVGNRVRVQGFTGDVANNLFSAQITDLTAGKMIIGGPEGGNIVDDAAGESVTITKWLSVKTQVPVRLEFPTSLDLTANIAAGTDKAYKRAPRAFTIQSVRASLFAQSTSGTVTVDINVNGATILSTKLTIDVNEKTSLTAAAAAVLSSVSIVEDDIITIDIDGAGTGAKGLVVTILGA